MATKPASEGRITMYEALLPSQANYAGNVHGGEMMKLMDNAAYIAARKYSHVNVVTARVDVIEFLLPIYVGELVTVNAKVVYVGRSSMEVSVTVHVEDLDTEVGPKLAQTAFFTMVAIDKKGMPSTLPQLLVSTPEEIYDYEEGKKRHEAHKAKRDK